MCTLVHVQLYVWLHACICVYTLEEETKLNFIILFRNECSNLQILCMCVKKEKEKVQTKKKKGQTVKKTFFFQVLDFVTATNGWGKNTVIDLFQATDKVSESNYVRQTVVKITKPVPNVYSQLVDFNILSNAQKQTLF